MLFNHDFYKPQSDATHFTNKVNYPNVRDDIPLTFLPISGKPNKVIIQATESDAGMGNYAFNNVTTTDICKFTYDGVTYPMVYHRKDGGRSWDGYNALLSMITTPIDITGYERFIMRGSVFTNNASLDYKLWITLSTEPMPAAEKNVEYDFSAWKNIITGDHTIAPTNTQVDYDLTIPISDVTSQTSGKMYFTFGIQHCETVTAYSIYTGIKDLIFLGNAVY